MNNLYSTYKPSYYTAVKDLISHSFLYTSSLYALWYCKDSYASVLTIPFLGLLNIRTFIILHDCGHNSYTPSKQLNYIIGSILGIFTFSPFCWSYNHHNHHVTSGNKDNNFKHPQNETVLHTLHDYKDMGRLQKEVYKIMKHPSIFFTCAPLIKFGIMHRFEILLYKYHNHPYTQSLYLILYDTLVNNCGIVIFVLFMNTFNIFYHYACSLSIASLLGFMLFHNQHTFNPPYVVSNNTWNKKDSGLKGSSFIQIPKYLKYFTMGIEYHHIHHMNASIPGYNLQQYHEDVCQTGHEFDTITLLSMKDCYHNLWLALYDEDKGKYISCKEADVIIKYT
jgi:omega-6 fatty acid desaturase (delta-12 desaturase)